MGSVPLAETQESLVPPDELKVSADKALDVLHALDRVLLGRTELHRMVLVAVLARGHVLLEGLPGLGKTELVKALGRILKLDFSRVQFTPDLMPSDILGGHILQEDSEGRRQMTFNKGPVFTHLLLADEINRASPKTQSALLEAMQERSVTLMGNTRKLPKPFFVLASQNPVDLEGTYPLPEAQLDRFLFKLHVSSPNVETLAQIIGSRHRGEPPSPDFELDAETLNQLFSITDRIFIPKAVCAYIARLVAATHPESSECLPETAPYIAFGASPRAAIAIAEAARAHALLRRSPTVGFEDVKAVASHALNHRVLLNYQAQIDGWSGQRLVSELIDRLDETGVHLDGVRIG